MAVSFGIADEVAERFPAAQVRFVLARGLRITPDWPEVTAAVRHLEERLADGDWQPFDETQPAVASWHEAYRRFGTNPRRSRSSLDALSRRLSKNGKLPRIHPAVDAYNLISISYGAPAGAFDLDRLDGTVTIRFARPGDRFTPLGQPGEVEEPRPGEVVYAAGSRVLTRHWNHRDCDETKVTEASTAVAFMLERVSASAVPDDQLARAQRSLAELLEPHAATVSLALIDADTRAVTVDAALPA